MFATLGWGFTHTLIVLPGLRPSTAFHHFTRLISSSSSTRRAELATNEILTWWFRPPDRTEKRRSVINFLLIEGREFCETNRFLSTKTISFSFFGHILYCHFCSGPLPFVCSLTGKMHVLIHFYTIHCFHPLMILSPSRSFTFCSLIFSHSLLALRGQLSFSINP